MLAETLPAPTDPISAPTQLPLVHVVVSDDLELAAQPDVAWFHVLRDLDWRLLKPVAVQYYEALYRFNQDQAYRRRERAAREAEANPESRTDAQQRLFAERASEGGDAPPLWDRERTPLEPAHVDPDRIEPGVVPLRLAGRQAKCFFALLKAFLGMALRGRAADPETVHEELRSNPSYARACGFTMSDPQADYRQSDCPSLRKLEQFDQIMAAQGLWGEAALRQVRDNFEQHRIRPESTLVHDTTHYDAHSARDTVEVPPSKEGGTPRKKSQSRTTKPCRCADRKSCEHPWVQADAGAGTVVKSPIHIRWAHKASTLALPGQEVLLDAVAMSDAASHDSRSLEAHVARILRIYPELKGRVTRILDDMAADDKKLKKTLRETWGIELWAACNPRSRKALTKDLPKGIEKIRPGGTPVCRAGLPLDFLGCRHKEERFLFRAPDDEEGKPVCGGCDYKSECCRPGTQRRQVSIPFDRLRWIDPQLPYLSRRFQRQMTRRVVIERLHKRMKWDFGEGRLRKRGHESFQATLDKTLFAMHAVLAYG